MLGCWRKASIRRDRGNKAGHSGVDGTKSQKPSSSHHPFLTKETSKREANNTAVWRDPQWAAWGGGGGDLPSLCLLG